MSLTLMEIVGNQTVRIAVLEQNLAQLTAENQALQQAVKATTAPQFTDGVPPSVAPAADNVVPFAPKP